MKTLFIALFIATIAFAASVVVQVKSEWKEVSKLRLVMWVIFGGLYSLISLTFGVITGAGAAIKESLRQAKTSILKNMIL